MGDLAGRDTKCDGTSEDLLGGINQLVLRLTYPLVALCVAAVTFKTPAEFSEC